LPNDKVQCAKIDHKQEEKLTSSHTVEMNIEKVNPTILSDRVVTVELPEVTTNPDDMKNAGVSYIGIRKTTVAPSPEAETSTPRLNLVDVVALLRDIIDRDLEKKRKFGMYQDQVEDLWRVVDFLESTITPNKLLFAANSMDWGQLSASWAPCFHLCEDGRFCGRAPHWDGHKDQHNYTTLADMLSSVIANS